MLTKSKIASLIEKSVIQSPLNNFNSMSKSEEPMWKNHLVGFVMV